MSAKDVPFSSDARDSMLQGVDVLANAVKASLGPSAPATPGGGMGGMDS